MLYEICPKCGSNDVSETTFRRSGVTRWICYTCFTVLDEDASSVTEPYEKFAERIKEGSYAIEDQAN